MDDISLIVQNASPSHLLATSGAVYANSFLRAFCAVYEPGHWRRVLQHKFFLPDETNYSEHAFIRSAAELSVANHVRQKTAKDFAVDKKINRDNKTDVDVFCRIGGTTIAIEVKSPEEPATAVPDGSSEMVVKLMTSGRIPDFETQVDSVIKEFGAGGITAVAGKNKDATHKGFLTGANSKFSKTAGADDLNILFIAGGSWGEMSDWYRHLYAQAGLFTAKPFHPSSTFELVDIVILSNLRYWHEHVRSTHDWTLNDVFMLPRINPHGRTSRTSDAIRAGLSLFDHHLHRFNAFTPVAAEPNVPDDILDAVKLNHYVNRGLTPEEKQRYFPVDLYPLSH
jgi:hypothetical protein